MAGIKYHINPDTGRANQCTASVRDCKYVVDGVLPPHFDTKDEAKKAFEKQQDDAGQTFSNTVKKTLKNDETLSNFVVPEKYKEVFEKIKNLPPDDFDLDSYGLYEQAVQKAYQRDMSLASVRKFQNYMDQHKGDPRYDYSSQINDSQARADKLNAEYEKLANELNFREDVFEARGGWNRAFLVRNGNGHVHSKMTCHTCNKGGKDTQFSWQPQFSGKSNDEIIDAAGWRACDVCYPSVRGKDISKKETKMFSEDEIAKNRAAEERSAAKAVKEKATAEKGILSPDGGPLVLRAYGGIGSSTTYKTERSAIIDAVDNEVDALAWARNRRVGAPVNEDYANYQKECNEVIVKAVAHKHGVPEEEIWKQIREKAEKKWNKSTR